MDITEIKKCNIHAVTPDHLRLYPGPTEKGKKLHFLPKKAFIFTVFPFFFFSQINTTPNVASDTLKDECDAHGKYYKD